MMRLPFLCLLLLLPAVTGVAGDFEGSGFDDDDDEDSIQKSVRGGLLESAVDKTTGVDENSNDKLTLIIIIAAVAVLTLSIAAIVAILLIRRKMNNRQQGIYSVPTEQDQKVAV